MRMTIFFKQSSGNEKNMLVKRIKALIRLLLISLVQSLFLLSCDIPDDKTLKSTTLVVNNSKEYSDSFFVISKQVITWHKDRLSITYQIHNTSRHSIVVLPSLVSFTGCRGINSAVIESNYGTMCVTFRGANSLNDTCLLLPEAYTVYNPNYCYQFFAVDSDSTIDIVYNFSTDKFNLKWFHKYAYLYPIELPAWSKEDLILSKLKITPIRQKKIELSYIHKTSNQANKEKIQGCLVINTKDMNNIVQINSSEFMKLRKARKWVVDTTKPRLIPILEH